MTRLKQIFKRSNFKLNPKILQKLLELTGKLMETFPNSLISLWQSIEKNLIIKLLQENLQKSQENSLLKVSAFIFESIYCEPVKEKKETICKQNI